jgi:CelD/BcsL family acetyltransferase involved in cellulose biosynthesis
VAARVAFLLQDELYLYFSGFDPKWARYSVMTTTVAETIKWAIQHRLRAVNLSTGTDVSKTRWSPSVLTTCSGLLVSPTRRAQLKLAFAKELARKGRSSSSLARVMNIGRRRG